MLKIGDRVKLNPKGKFTHYANKKFEEIIKGRVGIIKENNEKKTKYIVNFSEEGDYENDKINSITLFLLKNYTVKPEELKRVRNNIQKI